MLSRRTRLLPCRCRLDDAGLGKLGAAMDEPWVRRLGPRLNNQYSTPSGYAILRAGSVSPICRDATSQMTPTSSGTASGRLSAAFAKGHPALVCFVTAGDRPHPSDPRRACRRRRGCHRAGHAVHRSDGRWLRRSSSRTCAASARAPRPPISSRWLPISARATRMCRWC